MKHKKKFSRNLLSDYCYAVTIAVTLLFCADATADESSVRAFVDSIKSVTQVKKEIQDSLTEECGSGHCWNLNATRVCDLTAGLDVKVGYRITGTFENSASELHISDSDLKLMKLIFSQCKPTNYQFWSYGRILHVHYDPSPKVKAQVNKLLGIK